MKSLRKSLSLLAVLLPVAALDAQDSQAGFAAIRKQIDRLIEIRKQPAPHNPSMVNPFIIGPRPDSVRDNSVPRPVGMTEQQLLEQLASTIRVSGFFERDGVVYVVINQTPRREGEFLILQYEGAPVNIRIARIEGGRMHLRLGGSETSIRY